MIVNTSINIEPATIKSEVNIVILFLINLQKTICDVIVIRDTYKI